MCLSRTRQRYALVLVVAVLLVILIFSPAVAAEAEPVFVIGIPEPAAPESEGYDEFDSLTWKATESCCIDADQTLDRYFPAALYEPSCFPDERGVSELAITFEVAQPVNLILHLFRYGAETDLVEFDNESFLAAGPGEGLWGEIPVGLGFAAAGQHTLRLTVVPGEGDGFHFWDAMALEPAPDTHVPAPAVSVTWLPPAAIVGKVHSLNGTLPLKFELGAQIQPETVEVLVTETATGREAILAAAECELTTRYVAHFRAWGVGTYTATVLADGAPCGEPVTFVVAGGSVPEAKAGKKR